MGVAARARTDSSGRGACPGAGAADARRHRGRSAHLAGLAAEGAVADLYGRRGGTVLARRWRAPEGEIDLVVQMPDALVFVEVKSGRHAAHAISERQWSRLEAAALRYTVACETGETPMRFDAAIVGGDGTVAVVENARGF